MINATLREDVMRNPWTNVYGLARSLLGIGTIGTILTNDAVSLFRPMGALSYEHSRLLIMKISLFSILSSNLELAKLIAILGLCLVISGWRPRITALLHWWISFSFFVSCTTVDGGDQATAVLSFLLLPVCLTDSRVSHWEPKDEAVSSEFLESMRRSVANSTFMVIRLQVAIIYFHAAVAKFSVPEWKNGTALYYWILDPVLGAPSYLVPVLKPLLESALLVTIATWAILGFEILLFMGLTLSQKWRSKLLIIGVAFHFGIALIFGLVSFFFAMVASLILFLRPVDMPWQFRPRFEELQTTST